MTTGILEKESTGGAIARVGFEYQDAFVLQNLPDWIAQSAFDHVVSEAIGDIEVCYFAGAGSLHRVMYEAKDKTLTSTDFWEEIRRFQTVFKKSPTEYVKFVLVCRNFNSTIEPLLAKLERLRGVGASFQAGSVVLIEGRQETITWIEGKGIDTDLALFVLDRVDFKVYASESAESAFAGELAIYLPCLDFTSTQVNKLRDICKSHVAQSSKRPVSRIDIESAICDVLAEDAKRWTRSPISLYLSSNGNSHKFLTLPADQFNGPDRGSRTSDQWAGLFLAAQEIGEFIKTKTRRQCVAIDGKQRMSVACLLGFTFSATRGFVLQIVHNGHIYRTDMHEKDQGTFFDKTRADSANGITEGVVCIGFPTPIGNDYALAQADQITGLPRLVLESKKVIESEKSLNLAISEVKSALVRFRSETAINKIHLFIKAPSVFSIGLGYRLNGVCAIQLYDWIDGRYLPMAKLE